MLSFFEEHESKLVYLDLDVPPDKFINTDHLFPIKSSSPAAVSISECPTKEQVGCTTTTISIDADASVEQHVFNQLPDPHIRGHFIVSEYFT
jgi:hypothetical protein